MRQQTGALDERITIKQESETPDGGGGATVALVDVGTVWAQVEPVRGQERVIADQERGVTTYRITVRNDGDGAAITEAMTIVWRSTTLNVTGAPNAGRAMYRTVEAQSGVET